MSSLFASKTERGGGERERNGWTGLDDMSIGCSHCAFSCTVPASLGDKPDGLFRPCGLLCVLGIPFICDLTSSSQGSMIPSLHARPHATDRRSRCAVARMQIIATRTSRRQPQAVGHALQGLWMGKNVSPHTVPVNLFFCVSQFFF